MATSTWAIDGSHSSVEFAVKHMMFSTVKGRFSTFSGTIIEDDGDHSLSSVNASIDVASIDTRDAKRDGHLVSPDFFEAEKYPTITFTSKSVQKLGGEKFTVVGDLTVKGVTKEVTLAATLNGKGTNPYGMNIVGLSAETTINRAEFGLTWNVALEAGGVLVGENIKVTLEIEAVKQ